MAQNLVVSYNGGKVSAQGMATAQNMAKTSTIGLTIAQTALNAAIGMGIGLLINLAIQGVNKLIHANEEAIESAKKLREEYEEFKSTNASNVSTLKGLEKEFKELSKGVSQYGDNISLTTEQYERYKEIVQQIVGMSPSLAEGYSTENGYIADKNGLLERAIELQEIEYRNELRKITNLENLKTSMAGYIAEYKEAFEGGFVTENMSATSTNKATEFSNALYEAFNYNERYNDGYNTEDLAREILKSLGIDNIDKEMENFFNENGYYQSSWFFDEYVDEIANNIDVITDALSFEGVELDEDEFENRILVVKDCAQAYLDMKDSISMANESIQTDLRYIAEYADGYALLSSEQQKFVNEFLKGFNIDDITSRDAFGNLSYSEDKMKSVKRQINDFVENLSKDENTKNALANLYSVPTDNQSISSYVKSFGDALLIIQKYCAENNITVPISIDDNSLIKEYGRAIDFAKEKFNLSYNDKQLETFFDRDFINTIEEIDKFIEIANAVDTAAEAIRRYRTSKTTDDDTPSLFSDPEDIKHLETYQKGIKSISTALSDLNNLNASDITSLMSDFSEYGEVFKRFGVDGRQGVGNLRGALEEIARQMKNTAAKEVPQLTEAIEEMFGVIENPKGSIDKISSEIEELETVLSSIRNGENVKNIESLINKYDDLADSVVVTADGYSIEEDALISLINARITNLNTVISYESELTKRTLDSIRSRIEAYGLEEKHISAITDIWKKTGSENAILDYTNRILGSGVSIDPELLSKYADYSLELEGFLDKIRELHDKGDSENSKNNTIDWMTTSISNLQEKVDDANRKLENTNGFEAQKEAIKSLNSELENLKKAYVFASDEYNNRYKNALYGLNKYDVDKDDIQRKIEAGFIFDTDSFPSEVAELINDAIDAWNGKRDADNKVIEIGIDIDENSIKSLKLDSDHYSSLKAKAELELDLADDKNREEIYESLVKAVSNYYDAEIKIANIKGDTIEALNLELEKTKELRDIEKDRLNDEIEHTSSLRSLAESKLDVSRSDKDTLSIYDEIERRINAQYKAEYALAEFEKDSLKIKELKLQKEKDLYDLEEKKLELVREQNAFEIEQIEQQRKSILDKIDLKGGKGSAQNYNDLIGLNDQELQKRKNEYEFEIAKLAEIKTRLGENSDEYREQVSVVNDIADSISECKKNTKEWKLAILQLPIDEIESTIEDLNEQLSSVQDKMEHMDSIVSGAQAYIQDEIDEQQKLKDVIQDQIDSLQKSNDERQRAIALQKAQYELERAYSQRSVKVYREGEGFVYEQSQEAIRDAQENLDNQKFENSIYQLEEQLEYYDGVISDLEEIKNQWASVRSEAEDYLNIQKALSEIGIDGIFNVDVIEEYTEKYKGLLSTVQNLEDTIDSFETFKKQIQETVDGFENGVYSFEETVEQITQTTSDFYESSGLEGEELAKKVDAVVEEIAKHYETADKAFNDSTKDTEDNAKKQKDAFEEITQKIKNETATQEEIIKVFSDEVEEDVSLMCENLVSEFTSAFSQLSDNIVNITNTINGQINATISQANDGISRLKSLLAEAKSIQSQIDSANQSQNIGGSVGCVNAFGANKTTSTLQKYHTGLENGLVGEKGNTNIKEVALTKLQPNEIPAILKVNEAVLTELQQQNVIHNMASSFVAGVKLPKLEKNNTTPVIQNINLTLPNVTNDGGYNRVVQELKSLQLDALQHSSRK